MNRSDSPSKQAKPFGLNGQREPLLPTTPPGDNTASYDLGFPPVTMILKSAGGLPPKGQDMNQILYELSSLARWSSSGAINYYDSAFSSGIGGYPSGSIVLSDDNLKIYVNKLDSNTSNPNSGGAGWVNLNDYLNLGAFVSSPSSTPSAFSRVESPDGNNYIVIANNKEWGSQDKLGNVIPLSIARGGTGATTAEGALINLGWDGSGRLINVQKITSSGVYTPTTGTKYCIVEIQGGGGAGGGSLGSVPTQASVGTGGNAGAYIRHFFSTVPSGVTITIGSGGSGVIAGNGNSGGDTSFGSLTAPGGAGGIYYAPQTPPLFSFNKSSSVTPTGGNLVNKAGMRGWSSTATSPLYGGSGDGGYSFFGGGGDGRGVVSSSSNGNSATGYGAGGGGATSGGGSSDGASGGNGSPGVVFVWEYS